MLDTFFQLTPLPSDQLFGSYDLRLVILSYLVATFASYIALDITGRLRDVGNTRFNAFMWLLGGAIAMGAGIWSMHFIGMLAFTIPSMAMNYDAFWTILSMFVAIIASAFALLLLMRKVIHVPRLALGGIILGFAIASMHYVGMEAMKIDMGIRYLPSIFILSIVIAICASEAALYLALKTNQVVAKLRLRLKIISAFIMGAAISGMHYTGMAATIFTPKGITMQNPSSFDPPVLAVAIAGVTFVIMGIAFFVSSYKEAMNQQLLESARQAGMAEVSASVLHNVGNVLNSVNVSSNVIGEKITQSKLNGLMRLSNLLNENKTDLNNFITKDPRGAELPNYITMLANYWQQEQSLLVNEIEILLKNIRHIKDIISTQQDLSRITSFEQVIALDSTIDEALLITGLDYNQHGIELIKKYDKLKPILADKVKLLQILVNIIRNAHDSLKSATIDKKILKIELGMRDKDTCSIKISDNGTGITPDDLKKIFTYGFTTKQTGHGFGLHTSALAAKDMGGLIQVKSEGLHQGATFILELPCKYA